VRAERQNSRDRLDTDIREAIMGGLKNDEDDSLLGYSTV
jgi:hypothetical protein